MSLNYNGFVKMGRVACETRDVELVMQWDEDTFDSPFSGVSTLSLKGVRSSAQLIDNVFKCYRTSIQVLLTQKLSQYVYQYVKCGKSSTCIKCIYHFNN